MLVNKKCIIQDPGGILLSSLGKTAQTRKVTTGSVINRLGWNYWTYSGQNYFQLREYFCMKKLYDTSVSGQRQENYYMCDDLEDGEMSCPQLH